MDATDSEVEEGVGAQMDATDSEGEGAADQAQVRTEPGGDECAGGAAGGGIRKSGERQEATAIVLDKALKLYGKRIIVRDEAKKTLKGMAKAVLGRLLGRPPLSGSMDRDNVIRAIDGWLPKHGAVASALRLSPLPCPWPSMPADAAQVRRTLIAAQPLAQEAAHARGPESAAKDIQRPDQAVAPLLCVWRPDQAEHPRRRICGVHPRLLLQGHMLLASAFPGFRVQLDWILLRAGDCRGTSVLGTWAWQNVEQERRVQKDNHE